jgi:hypothetical protein
VFFVAEFTIKDFSKLSEAQMAEAVMLTPPREGTANARHTPWGLMKNYDILLVMLKGETPVGLLGGWVGLKGREKCLNIKYLYTKVSPAHKKAKGKTVAESLVDAALNKAKGKGITVFGFLRGREVAFIRPHLMHRASHAMISRFMGDGSIEPVLRKKGPPKYYAIKRRP